MTFYISPPPQGPLARLLTAIVGLLVLVGAFMLGIVTLFIVAGLGLLAWLGVWLRMLWIRRHHQGQAGEGRNHAPDSGSTEQPIETEYTVISRKQER